MSSRGTPATKIAKLDVRSFKAFERFAVHFSGDGYLVGPNNAGKSTLISTLRTAARMLRYAKSRAPTVHRDDGVRGKFLSYSMGPDQYGLTTENLRHEFHPVETRIEVTFSNKAVIRAVWPAADVDSDAVSDETGFFYLIGGNGMQPQQPREVRQAFPVVGVIPVLSPIEHDERNLSRDYVLENFDGRLASRHCRNQLSLLKGERDTETDQSMFEAFIAFVHEWAPEIEVRDLVVGDQINLYYRETGRRSEKEIFWAGDGFQVWLQLLLHLFRLRDAPSIVLDEPDVFLHADLQRRLVRLIETLDCQTITATHSAEMLHEAPPESVIWVDKSRTKGVRAPKDALLSQLSDALGSQFNLRLAKALRARTILFVEGDDMKLLRVIAATVNAPKLAGELGTAIIPLHGFSNWEHVEPFAWLVNDFLNQAVAVFVVLDSDYRGDAAAGLVRKRLSEVGATPHIWKRKELESYFLHPAAIARGSGADEDWIRRTLLEASENLKDKVTTRMLDEYLREHGHEMARGAKDRVTLMDEFAVRFRPNWANDQWKLQHCPPKELLKFVNAALDADGKRSVTFRNLVRELRVDEVPDEMLKLITQIEDQV